MAKRKQQPADENQQLEAGSAQPEPAARRSGKKKSAVDYRHERDELAAHIERMQMVNNLIRDAFGEGKDVPAISRALIDQGFDPEEVIEIMKPKPSWNGKAYRGYTFDSIKESKEQVQVLDTIIESLEHGKGFAARELERREQSQGESLGL